MEQKAAMEGLAWRGKFEAPRLYFDNEEAIKQRMCSSFVQLGYLFVLHMAYYPCSGILRLFTEKLVGYKFVITLLHYGEVQLLWLRKKHSSNTFEIL